MKRLHVVSTLVLAVFIATFSVIDLVLVVATSSPAEAAVVSFCQNNSTGVLKFAPQSLICPRNNTLVQIDTAAVGQQGPKGDKGDKGDQGIQGIQGPKGDKGNQGIQGIQGIQGTPGVANGITRAVHGIVNWMGDKLVGTPGFTAVNAGCGTNSCTTIVNFSPYFNSPPTCVVVPYGGSFDQYNTMLMSIKDINSYDLVIEVINHHEWAPQYSAFTFICVE